MAYIMDSNDPTPKRTPLWIAIGVVVVVLVTGAFFIGRNEASGEQSASPTSSTDAGAQGSTTRPTGNMPPADGGTPQATDPATPSDITAPAVDPAQPEVITWESVGLDVVPFSSQNGPFETADGLASGFAHNERGAVLAALNISIHTSSNVGEEVYEPTVREQCYGDPEAYLHNITQSQSSSAADAVQASEYWYSITSGDPNGDVVRLEIVAETPDATDAGGYAGISRTVKWIDGDWKLLVPPSLPKLVTDISGHISLGRP